MLKSVASCLVGCLLVSRCAAQQPPLPISVGSDQPAPVVPVPVVAPVTFTGGPLSPMDPSLSTPMLPGRMVEADTVLTPGIRLLAEWSGKWLPVNVLEVKPDGRVRIHWVGWSDRHDEEIVRSRLRFVLDPTPVRKPARRGMVPALPTEYEEWDKNGDGQIGMYEWERSKYSEFARLDKNGDGFLTPQELNAKGNFFGTRTRGRLERDALPNPGNLSAYGQRMGESFAFSVTGRTTGSIYGTGTYTTDSDLATAAVHAGLVKDGETGVVQVTIVESPNQFASTVANGVTSNAWGAYPVAYTLR